MKGRKIRYTEFNNAETPTEIKLKKNEKRETSEFKHNFTASISIHNHINAWLKTTEPSYLTQAVSYIRDKTHSYFSKSEKEEKEAIDNTTFADILKPLNEQTHKIRKQIAAIKPENKDEALTTLQQQTIDKLYLILDQIEFKKIPLFENLIREHALRRTQLFFYACVAIEGSNINIKKTNTDLQHGTGAKKFGTNACHSSLFPNLNLPDYDHTLLKHLMNMTIELPRVVNSFDCQLEGTYSKSNCVQECTDILNKIAKKELTIPEAMHWYFIAMTHFFEKYERHILNSNKQNDLPKTNRLIWEIQKEGTFLACQDHYLNTDYLNLWLEISSKQSLAHKITPAFFWNPYINLKKKLLSPFESPYEIIIRKRKEEAAHEEIKKEVKPEWH